MKVCLSVDKIIVNIVKDLYVIFFTVSFFQKEAPDSVLTSVDVPDIKSIQFHPVKPTSNHRAAENQNQLFPLDKIPFKFQLDDVHSNFVQVCSAISSILCFLKRISIMKSCLNL